MLREDRLHRRASELDKLEQHYLVGRDQEIRLFHDKLDAGTSEGGIINVFGTGGVGKSYLLNEYRRLSLHAHVKFILLDCRVFPGNPSDFIWNVLRALRYPIHHIDKTTDVSLLTEVCLEAIREMTISSKIVLALDTFEAIGETEHWLREHFLIHLNPEVLIIIAGRFPLQGAWRVSPAWRRLITRLPLADLDYDSVKQYLERSGIEQEERIRYIWRRTKGHALTLSLLASTTLTEALHKSTFADESGIFAHIVNTWLQEVPDPFMRELVEATAVLRHFNQELLSHVLEKQVTTEQFRKLTGYSFVQQVERGWLLHDLLRDAIGVELRLRRPEFHNRLWKRCVLYYCSKMKQSARSKSAAWENAEILYYIGNHFIQFLLFQQSISYTVEPLHPSNWAEAERYIERRRLSAKDGIITFVDRETNEQVEYIMSAKNSLNILKQIQLKELYDLDPNCIQLIRNAEGMVYGLLEIIPINEDTMDYLMSQPISSAYFTHLSDAVRNELKVPGHLKAGYFVKTLDVYDYADGSMMQASLSTFIIHILTAGYVVAAPVEIPISYAICTNLGLEKVQDVVHYDYDGKTPTSYYVMDTRGSKIHDYLNKMIATFGLAEEEDKDRAAEEQGGMQRLSKREKEIAELLIQGRSNKDIAVQLYLSEVTVKKHAANIYKKLDIKNRVQLVHKYSGK
ncbi:helix-turn-helix transcriptional regulator [Paenibacillus kobensis]|uniref:helix-turn-helix transcriptional regulator n=1 Tax=Paenibacillus kobensis TaxID=59841 RepID=UPI001C3FEA75|nr:LuxR family transcriptional regulator [Paenibacillus kobensis]